MKFTGERFIPDDGSDMQLTYEHTHRYEYIKEIVRDKTVLDIASGEGYGSAILAKTAKNVKGIDIDPQAIKHAAEKYKQIGNLNFECGNVTNISLSDKSIDVIVSYETIEHIVEHENMLNEFKRVIKDDGVLIISTPDKKIYTDQSGKVNNFHVKELYKDEFYDLLKSYFNYVTLYGQRFLTLSSILPMDSYLAKDGEKIILGDLKEKNSVYIIAICSNAELSTLKLNSSLYYNPELDLYSKDKAMLRWASSVHNELMKSQQDYFRLEAEFLEYKKNS